MDTKKEEIEQKISGIKRVLEKDVTTFERKILNDSLKIWEKALSSINDGEKGGTIHE